jgi:polyhydroxyalkanoate synthesis regulator phasin
MEDSISRLVQQLVEAPAGSRAREEARAGLVAGARIIVESLLELAASKEPEVRSAAISALADITMSIHQASFTARHGAGGRFPGLRSATHEKLADQTRLFGEVAIERGLARVEDVLRALNVQKREVLSGRQPRLIGEILVSEGVLGADQVKTVLMAIRSRVLKDLEQQLAATDNGDV